ncbi:hypothetical protein BAUCODRAFT_50318, partial [Baudoinia panamericana UAMH 10762]
HAIETPESMGSAPTSISEGATPEASTVKTADPSVAVTPTVANGVPSVSPPSTGRSTEASDLRRTRTVLPPAFVPSVARQTPALAAVSTQRSSQPQMPRRNHHPSASNIVFGGRDSAPSSPAPPMSAESAQPPPRWPALNAAQPSSFVPSPYLPNGHTHHASESSVQRMPPPNFVPTHSQWSRSTSHVQHGHPISHSQQPSQSSFRYPPREVFTPAEEHPPNGHFPRSRSTSQTSSAAVKPIEDLQSPIALDGVSTPSSATFRDPRNAFFPGPPQLRHHHPYHAPPSSHVPHPDMAQRMENAEALRHHVLSQFAQPALSDCHLHIREVDSGARQDLDAHKMIVSRSTMLLDLIQCSEPPSSATLQTQVNVSLQGKHVRIKPFMECVQYLYGGPLSSLNHFRQSQVSTDASATNEERMESALQLVATGAWLKLSSVSARAMGFALNLLHWDTLSPVLAFALEGGLGPNWAVDDGREMSCASSDDSMGRPEGPATPTYEPYASDLLHRLIDFTVHMFPPNFYLDASAPQLPSCPRLPPMPPSHESRPSRSNPLLSHIRFGEIPAEDHNRPSAVTTTISSMLLSLPFALLKCILEHHDLVFQLGADTVASIMRQVVAEREVRRKRVLQARTSGPSDDGAEAHLVHTLYFEEEVEPSPQHRAGFRLARRKKGIDTPPSSGAASEQSK